MRCTRVKVVLVQLRGLVFGVVSSCAGSRSLSGWTQHASHGRVGPTSNAASLSEGVVGVIRLCLSTSLTPPPLGLWLCFRLVCTSG
jgi:hypothetical protein